MGKYRMILIFDRIFHIKAFYSQIWRLPSLKKKNTAFYVEYLLYLTLKIYYHDNVKQYDSRKSNFIRLWICGKNSPHFVKTHTNSIL